MYWLRTRLRLLLPVTAAMALVVVLRFTLSNVSNGELHSWGPWHLMAGKKLPHRLRSRAPTLADLFHINPVHGTNSIVFSMDFTATKVTTPTCAFDCEVSLISKDPIGNAFSLTMAQNDKVIWLLLTPVPPVVDPAHTSARAIGLLPNKIVNAHFDVLATHTMPGDTIMFERTRTENGNSSSTCDWSAHHQTRSKPTHTLLQKWPCWNSSLTMYAVVKLYQAGTSVKIQLDKNHTADFCVNDADCNADKSKARCDVVRRRCTTCSSNVHCGTKFDNTPTTCDAASGTCVVPDAYKAGLPSGDRPGVDILPTMVVINADHGVAILTFSLLRPRPRSTPIKLLISGAPSTHYTLRCEETNTVRNCFDAPSNTLFIPAHHKNCALRVTGSLSASAVGFVVLSVVVATVEHLELRAGLHVSASIILTDLPHRACMADTDCADNAPCHSVSKVCSQHAPGLPTQLSPAVRTTAPKLHLLHSEDDWDYFKIPIPRKREKITPVVVHQTCVGAGTRAMCNAGPPCVHHSETCIVTPLSTNCANPAEPLATKMCGPASLAKCEKLNKVFAFFGREEDSACGIIDGKACEHSSRYASDDAYFALCAKKRAIALAVRPPQTTAKSLPTTTAEPSKSVTLKSAAQLHVASVDCRRFFLNQDCPACDKRADQPCVARGEVSGLCSSDGKKKCSNIVNCGAHKATSCQFCGKKLGDRGCHGECGLVEEMKGTSHNACMKKYNQPLCSYYPLRWTESNVNEKGVRMETLCLELMNATHHILKKLNIEYAICRGTAIGLARHGYFIPWDDDVDMCIKTVDETRKITASLARDKQWCTTPFWGGVKVFACGAQYNYPFIDVFDIFRNDFLYPPVEASFGPLVLHAPHDIRKYLTDQFGSNVTKECESPHYDHKLSKDLHQSDDMRRVLCSVVFEKCGAAFPARFNLV